MDVEKLLRGLDEVEKEAERRQAGDEPDRRFDLAIDVTLDLADAIDEGREPPTE